MAFKVESEKALIEAAARLRMIAGPEWDSFVAAMDMHTSRIADTMVMANVEHLPRLQGRAVESKELTELFHDIVAQHKKLSVILKKGQTP